jgi:RimJ/RimL family protein N-acetyltransferase
MQRSSRTPENQTVCLTQPQADRRVVEVDRLHRRANFNVVIGEKTWWGKGVVNEARAALLDEFFERRDIDKAVGTPLARNFPAIFNYKAQRHEGTLRGHCRSVAGDERLDQLQFGISKEERLQRRIEVQS